MDIIRSEGVAREAAAPAGSAAREASPAAKGIRPGKGHLVGCACRVAAAEDLTGTIAPGRGRDSRGAPPAPALKARFSSR